MLRFFLLSFVVSLGIGYITLRWQHLHVRFTSDVALRGTHKVHGAAAVSRIGGLSIFIGWICGIAAASFFGQIPGQIALIWIVCVLPAFIGGLAEDVTKRIPPSARLAAAIASAALAYGLLGAAVTRIDIPGIDSMLAFPVVAFAFTCFAIGGVAHAINIIDGLNGLTSGVCLIALFALGYVAFQVDDSEILLMCGLCAGALLGFRVWNYPSGRIFCGDGGAYFIGAYVAMLSAMLVYRHDEISAWFPLLLVLYPVWETLFSAYRRRVLRGRPASAADKLHMHTLFYKRVKKADAGGRARTQRNSDASVPMMLFACGSTIPAVLWWSEGTYLLTAAVAYVFIYLAIYRRLVRFGARHRYLRKSGLAYVAERVVALHRAAVSRRTVRQTNKVR